MTRLFNDPVDFADEMIEGFVAANRRWVRRVDGGVARSTQSPEPTVTVVIGGGSGHYPAFAGLVGPGLAHAAVMGNVFASPSAHQVEAVAREVERGKGVLFTYGNYAGDSLNFDAAQTQLKADGIDCRTVRVTDDIFSAPANERDRRRGIAGDLAVFKIAGAAAQLGYDLDDVERFAALANERTRSMGVAFTGCTLPGSSVPLFTVPIGRMAIGLGIHGEPGVDEVSVPTADGLAELFVDRLLTEQPSKTKSSKRVVAILNGLGGIKYEELFVVYRRVSSLLESRGFEVVDAQVGEFCTSFDMAGASLTLLWLDDELERLWFEPSGSAAFRSGHPEQTSTIPASLRNRGATTQINTVVGSAVSQRAAARVLEALAAIRTVIDAHANELGRLDSVAGDGDHGIGMQRGAYAAWAAGRQAVEAGAGFRTTLNRAGDAWSDRAGGTSGALWGAMLHAVAECADDSAGLGDSAVAAGVSYACTAVTNYGKAAIGDKTMVDALAPFADELVLRVGEGEPLAAAWAVAAGTATAAATATADLVPRMGRARTHGAKAVGSPDPGAISFALIVEAITTVIAHD